MGTITFEVEAEVEGQVLKNDPAFGGGYYVEDADISSVSMLVSTRDPVNHRTIWRNVDLLEGLDMAAQQRVIQNIFKVFNDDIENAILEDAE